MRILFVITELNVGGAERALTELAIRLDPAKFQKRVVSIASRPNEANASLVERLEKHDIPVDFLHCDRSWSMASATWQLRAILRKFRPNVAQSFLFHANVVAGVARLGLSVAHCLGVRVADPRLHRARIERMFARRAAKVVCVSESVADACRRLRYPSNKIVSIPNGVEVASFADVAAADLPAIEIPPDREWIAMVGRHDRQKGFDLIAPYLPAFFERHPRMDLALVGSGEETQAWKDLCTKHAIGNRVHFLGWRPDVAAILKRSVALILPSRWEGMPNALLEGMAAGLPVMAFDVEGVSEVLASLGERQKSPPENGVEFVRGLEALLADRATSTQLGIENRRRVETVFSLQATTAQYEALYEEIISGLGKRT